MSRYVCINCGYMIDLSKGVSAQSTAPNLNAMLKTGCGWHKNPSARPLAIALPPNTAWEDVPTAFCCPSCGAAKDMIEPL